LIKRLITKLKRSYGVPNHQNNNKNFYGLGFCPWYYEHKITNNNALLNSVPNVHQTLLQLADVVNTYTRLAHTLLDDATNRVIHGLRSGLFGGNN